MASLRRSKVFLFLFYLFLLPLLLHSFHAVISPMEVAVHLAGSVEERQDSIQSNRLYDTDDNFAEVCDSDTPCQVATALTPALLFCSGDPQYTTRYDYTSGLGCGGEYCCDSEPSALKFECDNASTVYWDCDNDGGTYTGSAAEDLGTVAGSAARTSTTGAMQTSYSAASSSVKISRPKATSASPAMISTRASPAITSTSASSAQPSTTMKAKTTSSGFSAGSIAGSMVGAILGTIALVIATLFGYKALKRKQQHRQAQSQTQLEGLLAPVELRTVATTEVREPGAGNQLSELPAENRHERSSDLHGSRAELL